MMADDLWRECAAWLTRCGVLRQDHKANWSEATMSDLALTLRDGVVICNLLNNLDPNCIDMREVNQKPQLAQFLCLRNIRIFIQVCRTQFDIPENDLFEPSMLFDFGDFFKVLHTLSKLSLCPKVQKKKNILGFSINPPKTLSQEDIYKSLNTNDQVLVLPPRGPVGAEVEHRNYDLHVRNEEIYQDLCSIHKNLNASQLADFATEDKKNLKRDYVINELKETEKNYVDVLATLYRCFMRPLIDHMKPEDFNTIFSGIKELYDIHRGFYSQLLKACIPGSPIRLSEVFIAGKEKFLIYGDYCANLIIAQNKIQDLCSRSDILNTEINKCQEIANNNKFKLRDILSVPMQRILKYHLLLEKLIDETPTNHEDYRGLERAKEAMVDVAQYINEVKRDSDTLQIMRDIQASISDLASKVNHDLKQYGKLVKDGELRVKSHIDQKVKVRYVFVFDQIILMCKTVRGDMYSFKELLHIENYKLEDNISKRMIPRDARWTYQWSLISKTGDGANYTIYARTEALKQKWVKAIEDVLDNIAPEAFASTDHKFQMYSFEKVTTCTYCAKFLKGRIFQGYRCSECLVTAHKQCLPTTGKCGTPASDLSPRPPMDIAGSLDFFNLDWGNKAWKDNENLSEHLWFVGEMGREKATSLLERETNGTYLLRIRPQGPTHPNETVYALSLKTDDKVKHMKVYEKEINGELQYFLSQTRFFDSIVELICFYERTSLVENFIGLNVRLQWPFRRIVAIAVFDFSPHESNQLPLKQGCRVIVLSKEGEQKGWWKGKIGERIGFFPKVYVKEISDTLNLALD